MNRTAPGAFARFRADIRGYFSNAMLTRLRIGSGVVLFIYLSLHLFNHSIGLVSSDAMGSFAGFVKILVRNWPVTTLLYAALLIHICLTLYRV